MSILGNIFNKIFHRGQTAEATTTASAAPDGSSAAAAGVAAQAEAQKTAAAAVDVEAVMNGLAEKNSQKLNWRTSIVDLMKLVGMESTLAERKELADELGYTGDKGDTATMNIWLHKQVMAKMAENGGKVPAALMD